MIAPNCSLRILYVTLAAVLALAAGSSGASAADHCVGIHPSCVSANTYPATPAGLASALGAANNNSTFPGADTVYIGAGDYVIPSTAGISLTAPLTVIGAGRSSTIVEAGANNVVPLSLQGSGSNVLDLSGLTIRHEGFSNGYGLMMGAGIAHDIDISVIATAGSVRGAQVNSTGSIEDSNISATGAGAIALYLTGSSIASGLQVSSPDGLGNGIQTGGTATRTIAESAFHNVRRGIFSDQGPIVVRDSFFDLMANNNASAVESENYNNCDACNVNLDATGLTVVGTGSNQVGVNVGGSATNASAETGSGSVLNSYFDLTGFGSKAMRCNQSGPNTSATLTSDYVAAPPARIERNGACAGSDTNLLDTTALATSYNLPSAGDYRPKTGSPLIDAGTPGTVIDPGVEDADGLDRIFDGDSDLTDRIDIGAYEYQPAMKPAVTFTATPTPVDPAQNVSFNATASDPDGGSVTIAWTFGDGNIATGTSPTHAYSGAGDYTVTATATDNESHSSATSKTVHVNSLPPTTPNADANLTNAFRGQAITFSASGSSDPNGDDFTYEWTFTGGGSDSGASVQRAATQVGTFTATVRAVDVHGQESGADSVSVTIDNRPPAVPTIDKDVSSAFRGETFTFTPTATDPDGDTLSHNWDFGDGATTGFVSAGPQTHAYSTVGQKTITLTVKDAYTGTNTGSTTVEVLDRAPVLGALTRSGGAKIGDVQTFGISATDADGDPVAFSWDFGDGSSGAGPTATHSYGAAGTYAVVASANDGQGAVVVAQTSITIDPPIVLLTKPSKSVRAGKTTLVPVNASSAVGATLTVRRVKAGWFKGKKCSTKRPTPKSKKRCDLPLRGTQKLALPAGASQLRFGPKWSGKKLKPGKYRLTVTPEQGAKPAAVVLTIL
jgi:PKD repeat protein